MTGFMNPFPDVPVMAFLDAANPVVNLVLRQNQIRHVKMEEAKTTSLL